MGYASNVDRSGSAASFPSSLTYGYSTNPDTGQMTETYNPNVAWDKYINNVLASKDKNSSGTYAKYASESTGTGTSGSSGSSSNYGSAVQGLLKAGWIPAENDMRAITNALISNNDAALKFYYNRGIQAQSQASINQNRSITWSGGVPYEVKNGQINIAENYPVTDSSGNTWIYKNGEILPYSGTGFSAPVASTGSSAGVAPSWKGYTTPERNTQREKSLSAQVSAPYVRSLRSEIAKVTSGKGSSASDQQTIRQALAGYGQGLQNIMSGAATTAKGLYNTEYQAEVDAAKLNAQMDYESAWNSYKMAEQIREFENQMKLDYYKTNQSNFKWS